MSIEQRNSSVAADMTRIFGGVADPPENGLAAPPREKTRVPADAPARPRRVLAARGAALAILLACASALGFLAYEAVQPDPSVPARTSEVPATRPPEAAATPLDRLSVPASPGPVESPPSGGTAQAAPAVQESPATRATPAPAENEPPAPKEAQTTGAGSIAPAVAADRSTAYDAPRPLPPPPPPRPGVAASRSAAVEADCPPGSEEDRCIYQDVLDAHRRLQRAYERAEFEGVPPAELRAVRRAWNRARDISMDEPDETIRQYDGLADYLRRAGR